MTKTQKSQKTLLIVMLGMIVMSFGMQNSFATSDIDVQCDTVAQQGTPDCQLLQKINDLETELKAKDAELEATDAVLTDKVQTTCDSIPIVKTGFGLVTHSVVRAFNTTNNGINSINNHIVDPLNNFNTDIIHVDPPKVNLGNILPNGIHVGTFDALGFTFPDPTDINLHFTTLQFDIPELDAPSYRPFAGIPDIPTIDTTEIDSADNAVQNMDTCT